MSVLIRYSIPIRRPGSNSFTCTVVRCLHSPTLYARPSLATSSRKSRSIHSAAPAKKGTTSPNSKNNKAVSAKLLHTSSAQTSSSPPSHNANVKSLHTSSSPAAALDVSSHSKPSTSSKDKDRKKNVTEALSAQRRALKRHPWMQLIKLDLSALTVVTSAGGYLLAGGSVFAFHTFAGMLVGSSLCATRAAMFNQIRESSYDAVMQRTRNRPLPNGLITERQARVAGWASGIGGTGILALAANPATAVIGASTILSYVHVYTPLKRVTPLNTEVGAVVGALPPILGWVAATGATGSTAVAATAAAAPVAATSAAALAATALGNESVSSQAALESASTLQQLAAMAPGPEVAWLFATLFAWQMHHFMAITWRFRKDYDRAGFQMISRGDTNGDKTLRKGAFWAASMGLLPPAAVWLGIANPMYAVWGTCANLPLWKSYYDFYRRRGKSEARHAMVVGFVQLPLLLAFLVFSLTDREKYTAFRETMVAREIGEQLCVYVQTIMRPSRWWSALSQRRLREQRDDESDESGSELASDVQPLAA